MVVLKAGSNELNAVPAETFDEALNLLVLGLPMNGEAENGEAANGEKPKTIDDLLEQLAQIDASAAATAAQRRQIIEQMMNMLKAQGDR